MKNFNKINWKCYDLFAIEDMLEKNENLFHEYISWDLPSDIFIKNGHNKLIIKEFYYDKDYSKVKLHEFHWW